MAESTFLWHDYETFGSIGRPWDRPGSVAPRRARPSQFAAIRTTMDLEEIDEPINFNCKPSMEEPPSVDACLVTGICPQDTLEGGLSERAFYEKVRAQFTRGTCGVGWNSFGYDDEVTRFGFWRNLMIPVYDREWRDGRSRWDLLPVFRLALASRPESINWPERAEGGISMRLEDLAPANGVDEHDAHDALGDVRATIHLARVFRKAAPKLWDHARMMNSHHEAAAVFDHAEEPLLLSEWWLGMDRNYGTVVAPVLARQKQRVVIDLHGDPAELLDLSASEVHHRMFHREKGTPRLPVQTVRLNQSPMAVTCRVLQSDEAWERLGLDKEVCRDRWRFIQEHRNELGDRLGEVLGEPPDAPDQDVEERLYGGFPADWEVSEVIQARDSGPDAIRHAEHRVQDDRLAELLFRFLAREHPDALTDAEQERWAQHLQERISAPGTSGVPRVQEALDRIEECRREGRDAETLDKVEIWTRELAARAGVELGSR